MVPTFRDAIRSLNLFVAFGLINLMAATEAPTLWLRTPSHEVPIPLFLSAIFGLA